MAATIERLGPTHVDALRGLLAKEASHNLYLLGVLEEFGLVSMSRAPLAFWGRFNHAELTAACFVGGEGGALIPSLSPSHHLGDIGRHLAGKVHPKSFLGEKAAVEALMGKLAASRPRIVRSQKLYSVSADDLGPFTNPHLRLATEADVAKLVPLAAQAVKERVGRDPMEEDPEGFVARVRQRAKGGRTYLLEDKGRVIFKVDLGSRSQYGAELEGLFTESAERHRGHATLCLGQISRHLLSSLPRLTLRIDDDDPGLATVARKVGYLPGKSQLLVFME